jgi:hypothetical protein
MARRGSLFRLKPGSKLAYTTYPFIWIFSKRYTGKTGSYLYLMWNLAIIIAID